MGIIMTAIFLVYFILAVNFTSVFFIDKKPFFIFGYIYIAVTVLSFVISGILKLTERRNGRNEP